MSALDQFISEKRRWRAFNSSDLCQAANGIVLAADGKMSRSEALMFARAAFESIGMERGE